jgi:hypothetical protein
MAMARGTDASTTIATIIEALAEPWPGLPPRVLAVMVLTQ